MVTDEKITLKPFIEIHPMSQAPEVLQKVADHQIQKRAVLVPDWA
jgi:D-arabinose 1-dehydrogenase-like Zn-dependent alcohol dehydrogenase